MLKKMSNALMRGLVVVVPFAATIWLLWWIGSGTETLLRNLIVLVVPERFYQPGMGIIAALALLLAAGVLVNAFLVRRLLASWEALMERIPVVKSVYGAFRDFMQFLPTSGKRSELQRVVLARFGEASLIGFVTRDDGAEIGLGIAGTPGADGPLGSGTVVVYFPMSYMIGGYTVVLPRSAIEPLDMPVETAMRLVLTAGMSGAPAIKP